jgi:hypothetical protein
LGGSSISSRYISSNSVSFIRFTLEASRQETSLKDWQVPTQRASPVFNPKVALRIVTESALQGKGHGRVTEMGYKQDGAHASSPSTGILIGYRLRP